MAFALLLATPGLGSAEPGTPDTIAALIANVADVNQKLQDLGAAVQSRQEAVNKAIVDVQTARDAVDTANAELADSQRGVDDSSAAIAAAQHSFDAYAAQAYMTGPSSSYLMATSPDDLIATATADHTFALSAQKTLSDLQRARTEQLNRKSAAQTAKEKADQAAADSRRSQDDAVTALTDAQKQFGDQRAELDRLVAERHAAQDRLNAAQATWSTSAGRLPAPAPAPMPAPGADRWTAPGANSAAPQSNTGKWDGPLWDPTLPAIPSAFVSGDPVAIINSLLGISATSSQVTANMGKQFLTSMGILKPGDTGINNGRIPRVYGRQASEYVIRRAGSQMGVPYSWGGGNAAGPSRGIDDGAGTVGFDCSGLILYAFAGVGIKLPHYSGSQYNMGRKIPASQMRRGDVIFYGPGGSQHVTLYLGNGQMLEAPYTGSTVKVSPVRTSGMTPFVVRYIEY
ncbi:MAG: peptidoglycan DL-endopeptidase RipA [Mycobacterium sp.]|jgi:cell wall-associated NlpC family hydrolase|nr:peptidoglycan DL-endopeptidase RipA [Mycobacterium sp.]